MIPNRISLTKLSSKHPNVIFCNKEWCHMRFYETVYNVLPVFREKIHTKYQQGYLMYFIFLGNRAAKQEIWPCLRNRFMYWCQMQYNDFAPSPSALFDYWCSALLICSHQVAMAAWPLHHLLQLHSGHCYSPQPWHEPGLTKYRIHFPPLPGLSSYLMNH